jgi:CRP-like cAMP-binding protein
MTDENVLNALRNVSFLDGFAQEHLEKLAESARLVEFPEGKTIFREGEPASRIYLIVAGEVSLEICAPGVGCRRVHTVRNGELLGWSPVLEQTRLTATARTLTATRAIELNGAQVLALCEHDPCFGYEFMRRTARALERRLDTTRMQLVDAFGAEMPTVNDNH